MGRAPWPEMGIRTLLNAILLNLTLRLLVCDARDAVIVVVLGRGALLGVCALCWVHLLAPRSSGNKNVQSVIRRSKAPRRSCASRRGAWLAV
jgi:hypothetical protein